MRDFRAFVGVSLGKYHEVDSQKKRIAPGAVWAHVGDGKGFSSDHNTIGFVAGAPLLYAAAAVQILDFLSVEGAIIPGESGFALKLICDGAGVDSYIASLVRQWTADQGRNSKGRLVENFDTWKRLDEYCAVGKVRFVKVNTTDIMMNLLVRGWAKTLREQLPAVDVASRPYLAKGEDTARRV